MDGYHVALFVHIAALMVAGGATSLTLLAQARRGRATTIREAREWHRLLAVSSRAFPAVLVVLLLTGGFMMSRHTGWTWHDGWVNAGLFGIVLLGMNGGMLAKRGARLGRDLASRDDSSPVSGVPALDDALSDKLAWANVGIAVGEVFVMSTKPTILPALVAVAISALIAIVVGRRVGGRSRARGTGEATEAGVVRT